MSRGVVCLRTFEWKLAALDHSSGEPGFTVVAGEFVEPAWDAP